MDVGGAYVGATQNHLLRTLQELELADKLYSIYVENNFVYLTNVGSAFPEQFSANDSCTKEEENRYRAFRFDSRLQNHLDPREDATCFLRTVSHISGIHSLRWISQISFGQWMKWARKFRQKLRGMLHTPKSGTRKHSRTSSTKLAGQSESSLERRDIYFHLSESI